MVRRQTSILYVMEVLAHILNREEMTRSNSERRENMPPPSAIIEGLRALANNFEFIAILWHVVFVIIIVALIMGWRPSKKLAATALAVPLLSVSIFAWIQDNPFNGTVFLLFALLLVIIGLRLSIGKVQGAPTWAVIIGFLMVIFGWIYPHFLESGHWIEYLYAAPTGLIPCPTLSISIGFALLASGMSSRVWAVSLAVLGLFYGLFGAFRLGVLMDTGLIVGALAFLVLAFSMKPAHHSDQK